MLRMCITEVHEEVQEWPSCRPEHNRCTLVENGKSFETAVPKAEIAVVLELQKLRTTMSEQAFKTLVESIENYGQLCYEDAAQTAAEHEAGEDL